MPELPRAALDLAATQGSVLTCAQLRATGPTFDDVRVLVRTGRCTRALPGALVTGADPATEAQRVRAGMLLTRALGGCLESALHLHGLGPVPPVTHVLHVPAATRHQRRGLCSHWFGCDPADVVPVSGVPATSLARTLCDLVRRVPAEHGLGLLDEVAHQHRLPDRWELADRLRGHPALTLLGHVDPRSESRLESRLRWGFTVAGLPPDELQTPVQLPVLGLVRLDMTWRGRLVLECDGADVHSLPDALFRDRRRQQALEEASWTVRRATWRDADHDLPHVIEGVRRALARG